MKKGSHHTAEALARIKRGGKKGGKVRLKKMTAEARKRIARKGAKARWAKARWGKQKGMFSRDTET